VRQEFEEIAIESAQESVFVLEVRNDLAFRVP